MSRNTRLNCTYKMLASSVCASLVLMLMAVTVWLPVPARAAEGQHGDLDPTFGNGGVVTDPGPFEQNKAVTIQPDWKVVVAGTRAGKFLVMRYNINGTLDSGFGDRGRVTTPINHAGSASGSAVAVQPDGKIVVAGSAGDGYISEGDFIVVRYNSDGTLDQTFGTGGQVVTDFQGQDRAYGVAIHDWKIVVAGESLTPETGDYDFAVARYNATNGTLDRTFSGDGKVITGFMNGDSTAKALSIQSDGKIVAAGNYVNMTSEEDAFSMVRYNTDGTLDGAFDGDGMALTDVGFADGANDVAIQPDGRILAGGSPDSQFAVLRYMPDGTPDSSFDGDGKVLTDVGEGYDFLYGLELQPASQWSGTPKIVAAGWFSGPGPSTGDFALARYNGAGGLDPTFGNGGIVHTDFGGSDGATDVAIQPDGNILAVGYADVADLALARYRSEALSLCVPDPYQVAIYEHTFYQGRCVVKWIGSYSSPSDFPPLPDNSASSIRVGANVEAVLARDNNLTGPLETFTADDNDFNNNFYLGNDTTSSFKVQPRILGAPLSVTLAPYRPKKLIGTDPSASVTATVRSPRDGRPIPGVRMSFVISSGPNAGDPGFTCLGLDCRTDANGRVSWTWHGYHNKPGIDSIVGFYDKNGDGKPGPEESSGTTELEWIYAKYAALGDSFSSGEGVPPYQDRTDEPYYNECHRSEHGAYPYHVSQQLKITEYAFWACSGARTNNIFISQYPWQPPQINEVPTDADIITISIGGNDAGFGAVLHSCWRPLDVEWDYCQDDPPKIDECSGLPSWDECVSDLISTMDSRGSNSLKRLYDSLKRRAPDAHVIALGYPRLFPKQAMFNCAHIYALDQRWMNDKTAELNAMIEKQAGEAGVEYVNLFDALHGHELCSGGKEFIHGGPPVALPPISFHPTQDGQKLLGEWLTKFIKGQDW